jgi:ankyrin repeat protein
MTGEPNALRLLIKLGSNVNALTDDNNSPLVMAVLANNQKAAAALIENGADVRFKNNEGLAAFDLIPDLEEWINNDCFDEDTKARLKGKNFIAYLKNA